MARDDIESIKVTTSLRLSYDIMSASLIIMVARLLGTIHDSYMHT